MPHWYFSVTIVNLYKISRLKLLKHTLKHKYFTLGSFYFSPQHSTNWRNSRVMLNAHWHPSTIDVSCHTVQCAFGHLIAMSINLSGRQYCFHYFHS